MHWSLLALSKAWPEASQVKIPKITHTHTQRKSSQCTSQTCCLDCRLRHRIWTGNQSEDVWDEVGSTLPWNESFTLNLPKKKWPQLMTYVSLFRGQSEFSRQGICVTETDPLLSTQWPQFPFSGCCRKYVVQSAMCMYVIVFMHFVFRHLSVSTHSWASGHDNSCNLPNLPDLLCCFSSTLFEFLRHYIHTVECKNMKS